MTTASCRAVAAAWVVVMLALAAACGAAPKTKAGVSHVANGPLVLQKGSGSQSIFRPSGQSRWNAVFGAVMLCTPTSHPITIEAVHQSWKVKPESVTLYIRSIPARASRVSGKEWDPIGGGTGKLWTLDYDKPLGGRFTTKIAGYVVADRCSSSDDVAQTELLTVMRVGPGGAWMTGSSVRYRYEGHEYVAPGRWRYIACGDRMPRSQCE